MVQPKANNTKINEVLSHAELTDEDIGYLDSLKLNGQSLYTVALCLRGEKMASEPNKNLWRWEMEKHGVKV